MSRVTSLVASVGPTTAAWEALASLIGAGMVVGGFVGGLVSLLVARPRSSSERAAIHGGYAGGVFGLTFLAFDILGKHFV